MAREPASGIETTILETLHAEYAHLPHGRALLDEHLTPDVIRTAIRKRLAKGDTFDDLEGFVARVIADVLDLAKLPHKAAPAEGGEDG